MPKPEDDYETKLKQAHLAFRRKNGGNHPRYLIVNQYTRVLLSGIKVSSISHFHIEPRTAIGTTFMGAEVAVTDDYKQKFKAEFL